MAELELFNKYAHLAGEIEIEVTSWMLFPKNEEARNTFASLHYINLANTLDYDLPNKLAHPLALHTLMKKKNIVGEASKNFKNGYAAGHVFINLLSSYQNGKEATVNRAVDMTERLFKENEINTQTSFNRIMNHWGTYKPVAHFWAAFLLGKEKYKDNQTLLILNTVAMGEGMRSSFLDMNEKKTDAECMLELPQHLKISGGSFQFTNLTEKQLQRIDLYDHRDHQS